MIDPVKNYANTPQYYDLLRTLNPHLPAREFLPMDQTITTKAGVDQVATLTVEIYITLPDEAKIQEMVVDKVMQELMDNPMFTVDGQPVDTGQAPDSA